MKDSKQLWPKNLVDFGSWFLHPNVVKLTTKFHFVIAFCFYRNLNDLFLVSLSFRYLQNNRIEEMAFGAFKNCSRLKIL